jgi:hypothetical protein
MDLKALWDRFVPHAKPRESVELDPVQQLALRFLLNFGEQTRDAIRTEVMATRAVSDDEVDLALAGLVDAGLADSTIRLEGDTSQTFLTPTKKASTLKGHLPQEPTTVTEFYL